jgi:hypothetical protein
MPRHQVPALTPAPAHGTPSRQRAGPRTAQSPHRCPQQRADPGRCPSECRSAPQGHESLLRQRPGGSVSLCVCRGPSPTLTERAAALLSRPASPPTSLTQYRGTAAPLSRWPRARPGRTQRCQARVLTRQRAGPPAIPIQPPRHRTPQRQHAGPPASPIQPPRHRTPQRQHAGPPAIPIQPPRGAAPPGWLASPR